MERYIAMYDKKTEKHVKDVLIENDIEFFRGVFLNTSGDPLMYGAYPISGREARMIEEKFNLNIDLKMYDCFLECHE